ncbi:MAG: glycerate kinase [Terriglobia bacterium]
MSAPVQLGTPSKPFYQNGKHLARQVFHETMAAIEVRRAMHSKLKREPGLLVAGDTPMPLWHPPRVVAFGKAAQSMAATLGEILGGEIEAGIVVAPAGPAAKAARFRYFVGGHPYPNEGSVEGARAALDLVSDLRPDDAVIFLVSGGGSALFEAPLRPEVTLRDMIEFNRVLVTSHLPIEQINVLRKHVSAVKGGRLAARAYPARQLTVFISDVPESLPAMVASGPTLPDESTVDECYTLAERSGLVARLPPHIRQQFAERTLEETPKPSDHRFRQSHSFCLLSNRDAVEAAKAAAEKLGFITRIDSSVWDADYRQVTEANLASLDALARANPGQPVCLVAGGEVTCPVTGPGVGGRNQAFVLYAAEKIAAQSRLVLSAGSDGRDGNSPACGAVADGHTIGRARALGLDPATYLGQSDSYHFFCTLGDTLDTGYTNNNVRDVRLWFDFGL